MKVCVIYINYIIEFSFSYDLVDSSILIEDLVFLLFYILCFELKFSFTSLLTAPPQILPFDFGESSVNSGDMISATCTVNKGDFPINIEWTLNSKPLEVYSGIKTIRSNKRISILSIDAVSEENSGQYTCNASNVAGNVSYSTDLFVNG